MSTGSISMSRRHVLGDFYSRCDAIDNVPVYLNNTEGEVIGYADQGLGHYADAFSFHLSPEFGKKLSMGSFTYAFDFRYSDEEALPGRARRVTLNSIMLVERQNYEKPISRSVITA